MMKFKKYILLLLVLLLCVGCGKMTGEAPTPTEEPIVTPTIPPEPDSVPGTIVLNDAPAVIDYLSMGDTVTILGEKEEYYIVQHGEKQGLMEKRLIRTAEQPAYEVWTGYAKKGTLLYDGYQLSGEPEKLNTNTKMEVLEDLVWCYQVKINDTIGYVSSGNVSKHRISGGGGGGTGGGGGGQDGGDISLTAARPNGARIVRLSGAVTGIVLVDDAELCYIYFDRGEIVRVTSYDEMLCTIYVDGIYATVLREFVRLEGDAVYESWTGYAKRNAEVFGDYRMGREALKKLKTNQEITVLEDLGSCYLVEIDGELGFMKTDTVNKTKAVGGGGGGGTGGGTGGGGGGEWTPPMM